MRRVLIKAIAAASLLCVGSTTAHAQYYELANQATDILQTILQGGENYRGYVEASYLKGIGNRRANFIDLTTTHGYKYKDWFFLGVGVGIDYMTTEVALSPYIPADHQTTDHAWMVPLYTDLRFNIGGMASTGFFIDVKVGGGFYISNRYIQVGDGYVNSGESFLLRPSMGLRIPVSSANTKYAINAGVAYQLLTNSYWYDPNGSNSISLSSIGTTISFEW